MLLGKIEQKTESKSVATADVFVVMKRQQRLHFRHWCVGKSFVDALTRRPENSIAIAIADATAVALLWLLL